MKRKSGFLVPSYHSSNVYGFGIAVPYFWALAPNYDLTFTPKITTRQGPLLQAEWRHRLINGSYTVRATGIFQLDKNAFLDNGAPTPGYHDWRGSLESAGQFKMSEKWVWGWDGTLVSDKTYLTDYGLYKAVQSANMLKFTPDTALSQALPRGTRGAQLFRRPHTLLLRAVALRTIRNNFRSFTRWSIPTTPLLDPIFGGELGLRSNLTSLSRDTANFDPISMSALAQGFCSPSTADPAVKNSTTCLLRGAPGNYTRVSSEATWKRTLIDPLGQVFTPFISLRADAARMNIKDQPGVSNYINVGDHDVGRIMPTVGLEYRYPLIGVQPWGTQTIEPIAQLVLRPERDRRRPIPQ